jgi:pyruvyltransferase
VTSETGRVVAFWCRSPSRTNFGDALTPWLVHRITGQYPTFAQPEDPRPKVFVTGSVIAFAGRDCTVWGSGVMTAHDKVSPHVAIRAVRGPLTRRRAQAGGAECPEVYGDPGLLVPRFLRPWDGIRSGVAVAPHFSDMPRLAASWQHSGVARLVDLQAPVEKVVARITRSELVLSSSLHGIVVSHAYGVPAVWVEFRQLPSGDRSKFHDHQLSVGLEPRPPIRVGYDDLDLDGLSRWSQLPESIDVEPLWQACPFRDADVPTIAPAPT